jgi:hypothetical protein
MRCGVKGCSDSLSLSRRCKYLHINVLRKRLRLAPGPRLAPGMLDNAGVWPKILMRQIMISAACHQRFSGTTWLVQGVSFALEAQAFRSFTTNNRRRS